MTEKIEQLAAGLASDLNRELEAFCFSDRVQEMSDGLLRCK